MKKTSKTGNMMRFFITATITIFLSVEGNLRHGDNGKNSQYSVSKPDHAGAKHTEAFEILAELYSINKPNNRTKMVLDSKNILTTLFCDHGVSDCNENMLQVSINQFHIANENNPSRDINYPKDFDSRLIESMKEMESVMHGFTLDNKDDILDQLTLIQRDIESLEDDDVKVRADHEVAALSSLSIAKESVDLWHTVYNNPSHPLHGVHYPSHYFQNDKSRKNEHSQRRKLQNVDVAGIALADVRAGMNAATDIISENVSDPLTIILAIAANAIPASLLKLSGGGSNYYYGGDGDGDDEEAGYYEEEGGGGNGGNGDGDYYEESEYNEEGVDGEYYEESEYNEEEGDGDYYGEDNSNCIISFLCF